MSTSSLRLLVAATGALVSLSSARAQTPLVPTTKDFVAASEQSDHFEIVEGHLALAQSHDPRVRAFAQEMIQAHTQTSQAMRSAAMNAGIKPSPPSLNGDQAELLTALQSHSGVEFDRTYLKQQALAHQEALDLEQAYGNSGASPDVRQTARSAVPIIQRHLAMAQQLRNALGGR